MTQQAVSNALSGLGDEVVFRSQDGWRLRDPKAAVIWAAHRYPGPAGVTTYWWLPAELEAQYDRVAGVASDILLSGDLAADRIAAWRKPQHVTIYAQSPVDPTLLGFAMASRADYTLSVTVPADTTLWATAAAYKRQGGADPVIVAYDVLTTGTTGDQGEAAEKVLASVRADV